MNYHLLQTIRSQNLNIYADFFPVHLAVAALCMIYLCVPYVVARVLTLDHTHYQLRTIRHGLRRRFGGRCDGQGNMVLLYKVRVSYR